MSGWGAAAQAWGSSAGTLLCTHATHAVRASVPSLCLPTHL